MDCLRRIGDHGRSEMIIRKHSDPLFLPSFGNAMLTSDAVYSVDSHSASLLKVLRLNSMRTVGMQRQRDSHMSARNFNSSQAQSVSAVSP
jgi:hypothetical protein